MQDALYHEYKKWCSVSAVRILRCGRQGRYAVIYLATMNDVARALDESRTNKQHFMNCITEADVFLAGDELVEDK